MPRHNCPLDFGHIESDLHRMANNWPSVKVANALWSRMKPFGSASKKLGQFLPFIV